MVRSLADQPADPVNFWEVAPENWMGVGGYYGNMFRELTEQFPFICHGLSLSIGSPSPLDEAFLQRLKRFLKEHHIRYYSEHLSYCSDDGHLYDLMPIPFTEEAVHYVAGRINRVQDILGQRIAMENVSYYAAPGSRWRRLISNAVLQEADRIYCWMSIIFMSTVSITTMMPKRFQPVTGGAYPQIHIAGH